MHGRVFRALAIAIGCLALLGDPVSPQRASATPPEGTDERFFGPVHWFVCRSQGMPLGYVRVRTDRVPGAAAPLEITAEVRLAGPGSPAEPRVVVRDWATGGPIPSLVRERSDGFPWFGAGRDFTVADGRLRMESLATQNRPSEQPAQEPVVSIVSLIATAECWPLDASVDRKVHLLPDPWEETHRPGRNLVYRGMEAVPDGAGESLHRFAVTASPDGSLDDASIWVDDENRVRRVVRAYGPDPGRTLELLAATEEEACESLDAARSRSGPPTGGWGLEEGWSFECRAAGRAPARLSVEVPTRHWAFREVQVRFDPDLAGPGSAGISYSLGLSEDGRCLVVRLSWFAAGAVGTWGLFGPLLVTRPAGTWFVTHPLATVASLVILVEHLPWEAGTALDLTLLDDAPFGDGGAPQPVRLSYEGCEEAAVGVAAQHHFRLERAGGDFHFWVDGDRHVRRATLSIGGVDWELTWVPGGEHSNSSRRLWAPEAPSRDGPVIRILADSAVLGPGTQSTFQAWVMNPGGQPQTMLFPPRLIHARLPCSLAWQVVRPDGWEAEWIAFVGCGTGIPDMLRATDFVDLPAGSTDLIPHCGQPWERRSFSRPGTYRVRLAYSLDRSGGADASWLPPELQAAWQRSFEGTILSNEVEVTVPPRPDSRDLCSRVRQALPEGLSPEELRLFLGPDTAVR